MQEKTQNQKDVERERQAIKTLMGVEDLAEKKTRIFSRLLMDAALAQDLETLAKRHEKRKEALQLLSGEKAQKKKKETDDSTSGGEEEEE